MGFIKKNKYDEYNDLLNKLKPIIQKHNQKVFGKRFEKDLQAVFPKAYINIVANNLKYVFFNNNDQDRFFMGYTQEPIDAEKLLKDIDAQIKNNTEASNKLNDELKDHKNINKKFQKLQSLIAELDELS